MPPPASSVKALAKKVLRISLLVALFMAMAGIGAYVALTLIIKGEEPVVVPDLVGKDNRSIVFLVIIMVLAVGSFKLIELITTA